MKALNAKGSWKLFSVMLLALLACSSVVVHTERAQNSDFSHYKTFSWSRGPQSSVRPESSILNQEIRNTVNRDLAGRGLSRVNDGSADLLVSYELMSKTKYIYEGDLVDGSGYWAWDDSQRYPVRQGTFSIVIVDLKNNQVVWSGKATNIVSKETETDKQIEEAVNDLLKKLPTA